MAFDAALEKRLDEWGVWCKDLENNRIGYPTQSPLVAVIETGVFVPNFGPREPYLHPRPMEIAIWVKRLHMSFPLYAEALRDYYCNSAKIPLRVLAEQRGISIRTFKARVHEGKVWLSGRFSAEESRWSADDVEEAMCKAKK